MKCYCSILEDKNFFMCSNCQEINDVQMRRKIAKQSQAISKLSEYVDRINANSKAPFSEDVEEEIKKILE